MSKKHHAVPPADAPPSTGEENRQPGADLPPAEAAPPPAAEPTAEPAPAPETVLTDRLLRLQADFENFRKRMDREKKDWIAYANEKLVLELLPVLDHFELGLADSAKTEAPAAFTEGFRLIYSQLCTVLEKAGLQPIDAEGEPFDPHIHEAVTQLPADDVPENHVVAQTRRGYKLNDKLLRAAQVVVSSGPGD
ncbi:MAG: nucleotide exchange factor GrpE [Lentisphaerae bacterium]|jgi:molecular chaperone GrpE|nr:nucleotide exchange factor GrpE [Lentisphaerota bacterium]HQN79622.1 nucleotide exchange factor GrpE [Kiritimatiellia bacterium]